MSFNWNWSFPDVDDLVSLVKSAVTQSISSARIPEVFVEPLHAVAFDFGDRPPLLEFDNFPHVSEARTHVVFRLSYAGSASITLGTLLQANSLIETYSDPKWPNFIRPTVVAATAPLVVPFRIKLSNIELDTLVDIVYTPLGVTVSFRGDPVVGVKAESSLDDIPGVQEMIRKQLKSALSDAFLEDIPEGIWKASAPGGRPPDPYFGARRWSQHLVERTSFRPHELSPFFAKPTPVVTLFDGLSLRCRVPYTILAAPRQKANKRREQPNFNSPMLSAVSVADLLCGSHMAPIPPPPPPPSNYNHGSPSYELASSNFYGSGDVSLSTMSLASGNSRTSRGSRAAGKKRRVVSLKSIIGRHNASSTQDLSTAVSGVLSPNPPSTSPPLAQPSKPGVTLPQPPLTSSRRHVNLPAPHSAPVVPSTPPGHPPPLDLPPVLGLTAIPSAGSGHTNHNSKSISGIVTGSATPGSTSKFKLRSYSRTQERPSAIPALERVAEWAHERTQDSSTFLAGIRKHTSLGPGAGMAVVGTDSDWVMPSLLPARFYPSSEPKRSPGFEALASPTIY